MQQELSFAEPTVGNGWPREPNGSHVIPTHAISLYAPWVFAILRLGKDVENRGPSFPRRTGWVWLHASKTLSRGQMFEEADCVAAMAECAGRPLSQVKRTELWTEMFQMKGHLVGIAEITGRVTASDSPWFVGPVGLTLGRRCELQEPVPTNGQLGLWEVDKDTRLAAAALVTLRGTR